ncbi:SH3 domain-containing protein [Bombella saccharophila]|uniref:SH3 domain-containing protein n=1 Tax=Bombella saccharophila TaxID=2967338 RepID=A0ABT3WAI6_9PROT|nr:SH3 domain-containing protein [Bombella saccharophila]MCX5613991.1 SH3 domain-containing protein [Bombella saccharophila]
MRVFVPFSHKLFKQGVVPFAVVALSLGGPAYGVGQEQDESQKNHRVHHHGKHHAGAQAHAKGDVAVGKGHTRATKHGSVHHRALERKAAAAAAAASAAKAAHSAPPAVPDNIGTETKLPLPRFASMRADRVYMRRGPGERYPIDWVYHRRGYPVKIEREFGVWRLVEDSDGQKGWVHQVTLHGSRSFLIPGSSSYDEDASKVSITGHADSRIVAYRSAGEVARGQNRDVPLMSSEKPDHKIVALLEPGTVGKIKACPQGLSWCHVTVRGYDGWVERRLLWGLLPDEIIQPD